MGGSSLDRRLDRKRDTRGAIDHGRPSRRRPHDEPPHRFRHAERALRRAPASSGFRDRARSEARNRTRATPRFARIGHLTLPRPRRRLQEHALQVRVLRRARHEARRRLAAQVLRGRQARRRAAVDIQVRTLRMYFTHSILSGGTQLHSRVGVLPVHERSGYRVVSSARAQGARFVAAEAPFAEYRAVPLPEHEGRSSLVDASAQRESSRHRFWPARPRSGVDASFLLTEQPRSAQEALSD